MNTLRTIAFISLSSILLVGCGHPRPDGRGVDHAETFLQTSATGATETRPDEARFSVGVSSIDASANATTMVNNRKMNAVVEGLRKLGIGEKDIQTRQLSISRIDYGPNRNRFEANNTVEIRVRDVTKAGAAIAAATGAGANVLSGPNLSISDPEAAARSAYASAYKAARARADAYADAAGLKVVRILAIRDGGGQPQAPQSYETMADAMRVQTVAAPPPVLAGTNSTQVTVSVDFALAPK